MISISYLRWRNSLPDLRGMPAEDAWFAFRNAHHGRCAICQEDRGQLVIDHDHTTGLVRGLLCKGCNRLAPSSIAHRRLSAFTSSPSVVLYCQWPPADVVGIRERYVSPFRPDPAESVYEVLWHAGPDGIEHDRVHRMELMQRAINSHTVLRDPRDEGKLARHAHQAAGQLQLLLERLDRMEYVLGGDAREHMETCLSDLRDLARGAAICSDDPAIMDEIIGPEPETVRRYTLPTDADRQAAIDSLTVDE
ncbi:endonuclease domain-containing protein [Nonomuraea sp. NPDC049141]|uniref:endonuclease domain-containing protein n=1 Tax=Nonomuraea sp. NPDC049141 TaxID=3155500 RepID=UPI0033D47FE8